MTSRKWPCGKFHVGLSGKITWSQLAKIGTAPPLRLTILIPFIGLFLIFNEQTEKLFQFPQFFIDDIGVSESTHLSATNLYFTYFGLCFLGIASVLFSFFCPRDISEQPSQNYFVIEATSEETPVLAKSRFRTILDLYFQNEHNDECDYNPEYPDELQGDFHALMEEMYNEYETGEDVSVEGLPDVMLPTGYLDFTEFARMLWSNPRVVWAATSPFFDLAPKYAKDIAFVKFQALDHTRYLARCVTAVLYMIGFLLLLFPTVKVFILLSYGVVF